MDTATEADATTDRVLVKERACPAHVAGVALRKAEGMNRRARRTVVEATVHPNPRYDPARYADQCMDPRDKPDVTLLYESVVKVWMVGAERFEFRKMLGAWDFTGDGDPIGYGDDLPRHTVPDPADCDHCGLARKRNMVFVFEGDDGPMFVGSTCLKDVAGTTVRNMVLIHQWLGGGDDWDDEDVFAVGATGTVRLDVRTFIAAAQWAIEREGSYVKAGDGGYGTDAKQCTRDVAMDTYWGLYNGSDENRLWLKPRLLEYADAAIAWVQSLPGSNDFEANMKAAVSGTEVGRRALGIVAFIPEGYARAQAKAKAKAEADAAAKEAAGGVEPRSVPVPEGRQTLTGVALTVKWQESMYGGSLKMLVRCGGFDVWGSVPSALADELDEGDSITFDATVEASNDTGFGFFKRPTKATNATADERMAQRVCPNCGTLVASSQTWGNYGACDWDCAMDAKATAAKAAGHEPVAGTQHAVDHFYRFEALCTCGSTLHTAAHGTTLWLCPGYNDDSIVAKISDEDRRAMVKAAMA